MISFRVFTGDARTILLATEPSAGSETRNEFMIQCTKDMKKRAVTTIRKKMAKRKLRQYTAQERTLFTIIGKAIGATPGVPITPAQEVDMQQIIEGLDSMDEAVWERLYNVYQTSLHSSCCDGDGQPDCFRTVDSARITEGEDTFSGKLCAEMEQSITVCRACHEAHTNRHGH
jgi:hypothetical protein